MNADRNPVIVLGGGLAGIAAAWDLALRGYAVTLYEASGRLGGKAGSEAPGTRTDCPADGAMDAYPWSDHGYHLFPSWYVNVRRLMGEMGIDYDAVIVPGETFLGAVRDFEIVETMIGAAADDLGDRGTTASWVDVVAFGLTLPDLIGSSDAALAPVSIASHIRARFPTGVADRALRRYESLVLKALSGSAEELSALSLAKMFRRWVTPLSMITAPAWSALNGSLHVTLIQPMMEALEAVDVDVVLETAVEGLVIGDGRVVGVNFGDGTDPIDTKHATVIAAMPPDRLIAVAPELDRRLGTLAGMMEPMSAVDVLLPMPILNTPSEHFGFRDSVRSLTGYAIDNVWPGEQLPDVADATLLQIIAARSGWLEEEPKPEEALRDAVLADLGNYLPVDGAQVSLHANLDAKLMLNNVGIHEARPAVGDRLLENLVLAGDFMETSIDVASMEAAVESGRLAAAEVATRQEPPDLTPPFRARWAWRLVGLACRGIARLLPIPSAGGDP